MPLLKRSNILYTRQEISAGEDKKKINQMGQKNQQNDKRLLIRYFSLFHTIVLLQDNWLFGPAICIILNKVNIWLYGLSLAFQGPIFTNKVWISWVHDSLPFIKYFVFQSDTTTKILPIQQDLFVYY